MSALMRRAVVVLAAMLWVTVVAAAAERPPNVLLIISDDQSWTDFGFMGHPEIRTPHLDRLAAASAVFPNGYVPSSLCRPSLATIITGLYPHQHGITGNDPPKGTDRARMLKHIDRAETLPKWLARRGYRSLQTGKWWEGHHRRGGFTDGMTHGDPKRRGRHGDEGLKIGRTGLGPISDFLDDCGDSPFFIWYAPFLPHTPHNPPERLLATYRRPGRPIELARYHAMCTWFDETCGKLLGMLDRRKLSDNTLVLFVVDNGWVQRTPETRVPAGWRYRFAPRSKRSPNEGGVRTPIMIRRPGHVRPGRRDSLASSIDLAPTILAAVGIKPERPLPGLDLAGLAAGTVRPRETVYGEIFAHDVGDIDHAAASLRYRWCRDRRWKLIESAGRPSIRQLFDLAADPHESKNLVADHLDTARSLSARLDRWWPGR